MTQANNHVNKNSLPFDTEKHSFTVIPNICFDLPIPWESKFFLFSILQYQNCEKIYLSKHELSKRYSCSRNTVKKHLKILAGEGKLRDGAEFCYFPRLDFIKMESRNLMSDLFTINYDLIFNFKLYKRGQNLTGERNLGQNLILSGSKSDLGGSKSDPWVGQNLTESGSKSDPNNELENESSKKNPNNDDDDNARRRADTTSSPKTEIQIQGEMPCLEAGKVKDLIISIVKNGTDPVKFLDFKFCTQVKMSYSDLCSLVEQAAKKNFFIEFSRISSANALRDLILDLKDKLHREEIEPKNPTLRTDEEFEALFKNRQRKIDYGEDSKILEFKPTENVPNTQIAFENFMAKLKK